MEDRDQEVIQLERDAEKVTTRESLAVCLLCITLSLVTVYVAIGELWESTFYPDEGSYFTTILMGVLPRWAVVGNLLVAAVAHLSSAVVVRAGSPGRLGCDWLAISLIFNVVVVVVWLVALVECQQCIAFNLLILLLPNTVSFFMAYDCVKDKTTISSLLMTLRHSSGSLKLKRV
eukprot:scpid103185/ scgid33880/ 